MQDHLSDASDIDYPTLDCFWLVGSDGALFDVPAAARLIPYAGPPARSGHSPD